MFQCSNLYNDRLFAHLVFKASEKNKIKWCVLHGALEGKLWVIDPTVCMCDSIKNWRLYSFWRGTKIAWRQICTKTLLRNGKCAHSWTPMNESGHVLCWPHIQTLLVTRSSPQTTWQVLWWHKNIFVLTCFCSTKQIISASMWRHRVKVFDL